MLSCRELDKKIDTTLTSVHYIKLAASQLSAKPGRRGKEEA